MKLSFFVNYLLFSDIEGSRWYTMKKSHKDPLFLQLMIFHGSVKILQFLLRAPASAESTHPRFHPWGICAKERLSGGLVASLPFPSLHFNLLTNTSLKISLNLIYGPSFKNLFPSFRQKKTKLAFMKQPAV